MALWNQIRNQAQSVQSAAMAKAKDFKSGAFRDATMAMCALIAAADAASEDPITAGFRTVAADALPMPSIPEMASVWEFWGVTEASIINGSQDPTAAWQKMVSDIEGAIGS